MRRHDQKQRFVRVRVYLRRESVRHSRGGRGFSRRSEATSANGLKAAFGYEHRATLSERFFVLLRHLVIKRGGREASVSLDEVARLPGWPSDPRSVRIGVYQAFARSRVIVVEDSHIWFRPRRGFTYAVKSDIKVVRQGLRSRASAAPEGILPASSVRLPARNSGVLTNGNPLHLQLVTMTFDPERGQFPSDPLRKVDGEVVSVVEHLFTHDGLPRLLLIVQTRLRTV